MYSCDDQGSADQYVEAVNGLHTNAQALSPVCCRLVDVDNWIGWRQAGTGASGLRLSSDVATTITDHITFQGAVDHDYRVECSGTAVSIYDDGSLVSGSPVTITDHQTETTQGVVSNNDSAYNWLGDFEAGPLAAGGTHPVGPLGHPLHGPMAGPI